MTTSRYRHRMSVEAPTQTVVDGQPKQTWAKIADLWGSLENSYKGEEMLGGTRQSMTDKMVAYAFFRIRTRYRRTPTFSVTHRIRYDGRIFEIMNIKNTHGRERELSFDVREVQA